MKIAERGQHPSASPFSNRAQGKVVEPSVCKTELPGARPFSSGLRKIANPPVWGTGDNRSVTGRPDHFRGHRSIAGPRRRKGIVVVGGWASQRTRIAQTGVRFPVAPGFQSGHEEDSNPRRSDRRDTRGSTEEEEGTSGGRRAGEPGCPTIIPIPPKRRERRTSLVTMRDRCKSGWRMSFHSAP